MAWNRAEYRKHGWASFAIAWMIAVFGGDYDWLSLPFFIVAAALFVVAIARK